MWEFMTGRDPFWDRPHDLELIIYICNGHRLPTNDINVPEGYIELMKGCWDSDPNKRPTAVDIKDRLDKIMDAEKKNKTCIKKSPDIGPVTENNHPKAIYSTRYVTDMIRSAISLKSSESLNLGKYL